MDRRGGGLIVSIGGTDAASEGLISRRPGLRDSYEKDPELQARVQTLYKELAPEFGWMTPIDGSKGVGLAHDPVVQTVKDGLRVRSGRPEDDRP